MEKAYKIRHIPTGKYLSKYIGGYQHKWTLGPKGKTWSVKLHSLIEGGVIIDGKLVPESEFEFVEFVTKKSMLDTAEEFFDTISKPTKHHHNSLLNISNHQIQDILQDLGMIDEDGNCQYTAEEIFKAGIEYVIKKLNQ